MPAHGDRRGETGIEEPTGAGAEHAIKGVHDDLQRLRERFIVLTLSFLAPVPDLADDFRQAVLFPRETRAEKSFGAVRVIRLGHPLDQANGIDQKGANDRRIEAFIIQHQDRVIQARPGVHHIAARASLRRDLAKIWRDIARAVHARNIQMAERSDGTAVTIDRQAVDGRALQQERHDLRFVENPRHQLAVLQVVGGQRRFVFIEAPVNLIHSIPGIVDGFPFAEQLLRDGFQRKRGETPEGGFERVDTVDNHPPVSLREEHAILKTVLAPLKLAVAAAQHQRNTVTLGMLLQHAQVKLHHIPANQDIRIVNGKPLV
ncbi:hypothetical protein D3C72_1149200 [compost metagenome]